MIKVTAKVILSTEEVLTATFNFISYNKYIDIDQNLTTQWVKMCNTLDF